MNSKRRVAMNYLPILMTALNAVLSKKLSITIDGFVITASNNGAPVHFTFGSAISALEAVAAGATGSVQIGSTLVTITKA